MSINQNLDLDPESAPDDSFFDEQVPIRHLREIFNLSILFFLWKAKPQQLPSDCGIILSTLYADMRDRRKLRNLMAGFLFRNDEAGDFRDSVRKG